MDVAGYLGIASGLASQICDAINNYGTAFIILSVAAMCLSGGTLSSLLAGADYIVAVVLNFYKNHLAAQAVVW